LLTDLIKIKTFSNNLNNFSKLLKNNQNSKMSDSKLCKIIDFIDQNGILTPCKRYRFQIDGRNINKINLKTNQIEHIIYSNEIIIPSGLVLSKNNNILYVTDHDDGKIKQICTKTGATSTLQTIGYLNHPLNKIISPNGKKLYINDGRYITSLCLLTHKIDIVFKSQWLSNMIFVPDGKHLFVYAINGLYKLCLATNKCKSCLQLRGIRTVVISKDNRFLYISNSRNNSIDIVNIESITNENIVTFNPNQMILTRKFKTTHIINNCKEFTCSDYYIEQDFETFIKLCILKQSCLSKNVIEQF
jgi:DNA-binding beta-propeller fold protein YncE